MSEMVERVTDAIIATMFAPHEIPVPEDLRAKYLDTARAAIVAMREPSEAMKTAAFGPILNGGRTGPITSDQIRREASLSVYRAMINEALK